MDYVVEPGLYGLNEPDPDSPVLVTANYKLTFDKLRSAVPGLKAWIMVLETYSINVWCAAGKKTFGTDEVVNRIGATNLDRIVSHRQVILPQLGAPGVAAYQVKKATGFKALFGPIRAKDIPAYLENDCQATPAMRRVDFPTYDRFVLTPVELVQAAKYFIPAGIIMAFLAGFGGPGSYWQNVTTIGLVAFLGNLLGLLGGAVLTAVCLPWLPGRMFSVKGFWAGFLLAMPVFLYLALNRTGDITAVRLEMAAWLILIPAISSFLGMNFTGSSTYTSLSGVRQEMRISVPLQIAGGVIGLGLWITARFMA